MDHGQIIGLLIGACIGIACAIIDHAQLRVRHRRCKAALNRVRRERDDALWLLAKRRNP